MGVFVHIEAETQLVLNTSLHPERQFKNFQTVFEKKIFFQHIKMHKLWTQHIKKDREGANRD